MPSPEKVTARNALTVIGKTLSDKNPRWKKEDSLPVITAYNLRMRDELEEINKKREKKGEEKKSEDQRFYYAQFGGVLFDESAAAGKGKIFNDAKLFMANFRGCKFKDVDFSQISKEILDTMQFSKCEFEGNCQFPPDYKFKASSLLNGTTGIRTDNIEQLLPGVAVTNPNGIQLSSERLRHPTR